MAEEENEETGEDEVPGEEEEEGAPKKSKKLLFILAPVVLLLLGGGGYFAASTFGLLGGDETVTATKEQPPAPAYYHELPELVVNLSSKEKKAHFLKMKIALEVADISVAEALQPNLPRVLDLFQVYLRELRAQDLEGSQGIYRLKEELLKRINLAVHPSRVNRILFKEIIVQ